MKEAMGITMGDVIRRNAQNYPEKLALEEKRRSCPIILT